MLWSKLPCQEDGSEDEDSDPGDETVVQITHTAARCSIQLLQQHFVEEGFSDSHHTALDMYPNKGFRKAASEMRQTPLHSFIL